MSSFLGRSEVHPATSSAPLRSRVDRSDDGVTLVELIVYVVLLAVIVGLVATFFIRSLDVQRTVLTTGNANNTAQVAFSGIERDVRNAAQDGVRADGNLLVLYSGGGEAGAASWKCKAWYFVPSASSGQSGKLYTTSKDPRTKIAVTSSTFAAGTPAGWTLAVDGVVPSTPSTPIFSGGSLTGVVASMVVTRTGNPSDIDAVALETTALPRPQGVSAGDNGGCF